MLFVTRHFKVQCSEKAASHVMQIMEENHITIVSLKPYLPKERPDGPLQIFFECTASEENLDRFMEYFSKVKVPYVTVSY